MLNQPLIDLDKKIASLTLCVLAQIHSSSAMGSESLVPRSHLAPHLGGAQSSILGETYQLFHLHQLHVLLMELLILDL